MSSLDYLMVLLGAGFAATIAFFAILEHHKAKHDKKMDAQARFIWATGLVFAVCAVVTGVQVFDWFWVFPDERMEALGVR